MNDQQNHNPKDPTQLKTEKLYFTVLVVVAPFIVLFFSVPYNLMLPLFYLFSGSMLLAIFIELFFSLIFKSLKCLDSFFEKLFSKKSHRPRKTNHTYILIFLAIAVMTLAIMFASIYLDNALFDLLKQLENQPQTKKFTFMFVSFGAWVGNSIVSLISEILSEKHHTTHNAQNETKGNHDE